MNNPFVALKENSELALADNDHFSTAGHWWSRPEIDALILAHAARRPLLVRGEAGSGKSQIARAAAQAMGSVPLLVEVIHPRFEALDLLYRMASNVWPMHKCNGWMKAMKNTSSVAVCGMR